MSKRALRRHHRERIINRYKKLYSFMWFSADVDHEREATEWATYVTARGSIGCGCWMCANPRKLEGMSLQEKRFHQSADQDEKDIQFDGTREI